MNTITDLTGENLKRKEKWMNVIALSSIALLCCMMFLSLSFGIGIVDEPFYYTIAQRVLQGDRLLVDEWQVSQLFSVLLLIPFRLYTLFFGSTDGVILGMRYLYVACEFVLSLYLWKKLKRFGYYALFFILAVCSFGPMYSFTYYNVAVNGTALICAELFCSETRPPKYKLVFVGIVAAVVVLAEPLLALLYLIYFFCVLIRFIQAKTRKKENRSHYLFHLSAWGYLTLGILLVAIPFFVYYLSSLHWDLKPVFDNFIGLASDSDHEFSVLNLLYPLAKIYFATQLTGPVITVLAVLTVLAAGIVRIRKLQDLRIKRALFFLASGLYCLTYFYSLYFFFRKGGLSFLYHFDFRGYSVPIMFLGLVCILLSDHVKPYLSAFWLAGFIVSYIQDVNSQTGYGSSGVICLLPASILFFDLFRQFLKPGEASVASGADAADDKKQSEEKNGQEESGKGNVLLVKVRHFFKSRTVKKVAATALCACVIGISVFWVGANLYVRTLLPRYERWETAKPAWQPMSVTISEGPLKGIRTTAAIAENNQNQIEDMKYLMEKGNGKLYVTMFCPLPYLYTDFPMGTYSSCYVEEDIPARALLYWKLHPDRIPDYIYVPFCTGAYYLTDSEINTILDRIDNYFDCTKEQGKGGYMIFVSGVRTLDEVPG